jgi:hypothetical protein
MAYLANPDVLAGEGHEGDKEELKPRRALG